MASMDRVRVTWTGFPGAPGISTFFFTNAVANLPYLSSFFTSMATYMPTGVTTTVEASGDTIESTTGTIVGAWTGTAPAQAVGSAAGVYAGPVGAQVRWHAATILSGRRPVGKTFLVPMSAIIFQDDGTIAGNYITGILEAATILVGSSAGTMLIWQRPREATPSWTDVQGKVHPAKTARAGGFVTVTAASVPDKAIVLRSRRD